MRCFPVRLGCLATALLILAGCGDSKTDEKTKTKSPPVVAAKTTDGGAKTSVALPPKPKPEITKVALTAEEEATCLVKQNGQFPDAKLKDLAGADRALSQLRGERATVVLLWSNQNRASKVALQTLSENARREVLPGVRHVGVCVGGDVGQAKQAADQEGTPFPVLLDTDLALFKQVVKLPEGKDAADVLPRVFLLNPGGKVLWMSLALQDADNRDLKLALEFVLQQDAPKGGE